MQSDLFICHASLDKPTFVAPLARSLQDRGLVIWYDEFSLKPGDSVRRTIEQGIRDSGAGLVVLSPRFFDREWPQRELDALVSLEIKGKKRVVPIWLDIDYEGVSTFSPLLADRKAIIAKTDMKALADEIAEIVPRSPATDDEINSEISRRLTLRSDQIRYITNVSLLNLSRIAALWQAHQRIFEENSNLSDADLERKMDEWHPKIYAELRLPRDVYVDDIEGLSAGEVTWLERQLRRWCKGTLCVQDSVDLAFYLDEGIDTDYNYILFDIPHWRITGRQLARLREAIPRVGARRLRNVEDSIDVNELFLRSFTKFYTNPDAQQNPHD